MASDPNANDPNRSAEAKPLFEPAPPPPTELPSTPEEQKQAWLCHLGSCFTCFGIVVPIVVWTTWKDKSKFIDDHGKEALNFQITMLLAYVVGGALCVPTWGITFLLVWAVGAAFGFMGGQAAQKGQVFRYPYNIRLFIK